MQKINIWVFFRSNISNIIEIFQVIFFDQKLNVAQNRGNKDLVLTVNEMQQFYNSNKIFKIEYTSAKWLFLNKV